MQNSHRFQEIGEKINSLSVMWPLCGAIEEGSFAIAISIKSHFGRCEEMSTKHELDQILDKS